jgi:purine-binding chemotaxis protein CheW
MSTELSNRDPGRETGDAREAIIFRVGPQEFCIDIMTVREIRGWTPATMLPRSPGYIRGVINLRGTVLPILDLAQRLDLPSVDPTSRHVIVVVQIGAQVVGMLVDAVSDIITLADSMIQPTPAVASEASRSFVGGLVALDGRMINILRLENVLGESRAEAA